MALMVEFHRDTILTNMHKFYSNMDYVIAECPGLELKMTEFFYLLGKDW